MKLYHWTILAVIIAIATWSVLKTNYIDPRVELSIDLNWRFMMGEVEEAKEIDFDDRDWKVVSLPHDWMIEQPVDRENFSYMATDSSPERVGWYRKHLDLSSYQSKKQFYLIFDGVYMDADVWINGTHMGMHQYGYIGFQYDITPFIRKDTINIIAVRTYCSELPMDQWYTGAGIYRHVRLIASEKLHFPEYNTSITTIEKGNSAIVTAGITVTNFDTKAKRFKVKSDLLGPEGKLINSIISSRLLEPGESAEIEEHHTIENPRHWSPEYPQQYELHSFLIHKKKVIDNQLVKFGVRTAAFDPDSGFIFNEEKLWLKGVCIHHDGGELGAAVPDFTWEYRLNNLKKLGVNALRLAYNPHSPELLDMCDRMGFIVINEMNDNWEEKDIEFLIKRDRNHPSVIPWSIGKKTIKQFTQTGIDYMDVSIGWPEGGFRNGLLHTNGMIKPIAYYTQSIYSDDPMVKMVVVNQEIVDSLNQSKSWQLRWAGAPVVRHWTFPLDSEDKHLVVFTNCEKVELSLNSSIVKELNRSDFEDRLIKTNVPYEPGILIASANGLNKKGKTVTVTDTLRTAGAPAMIIMTPDKLILVADGQDVMHIETSVTDSTGVLHPTANHLISYTLDGPGKISVIDNGDPSDHTPGEVFAKRVKAGKHLVIIKSTLYPGDLTISAKAEGLIPATLKVKSVKPAE